MSKSGYGSRATGIAFGAPGAASSGSSVRPRALGPRPWPRRRAGAPHAAADPVDPRPRWLRCHPRRAGPRPAESASSRSHRLATTSPPDTPRSCAIENSTPCEMTSAISARISAIRRCRAVSSSTPLSPFARWTSAVAVSVAARRLVGVCPRWLTGSAAGAGRSSGITRALGSAPGSRSCSTGPRATVNCSRALLALTSSTISRQPDKQSTRYSTRRTEPPSHGSSCAHDTPRPARRSFGICADSVVAQVGATESERVRRRSLWAGAASRRSASATSASRPRHQRMLPAHSPRASPRAAPLASAR